MVLPLLLALLFADPRAKMLQEIGGLPVAKTPLNARVTGGFQREGYRVENVAFESLPGFVVTANLYIPTGGTGPFPAVLGTAGHSNAGKAEPTYQNAWITLARRGYVVLAYDPPGQGERIDPLGPGPGVPEHIAHGLRSLLLGEAYARYEIWDGVRAFDYLLTRPEVDPKKIAVAGNSGGGTQSAYLAVFEPRLAAAVVSCYITRWKELMDGPGPQDAEQIFPGFLRDGLDFRDFLIAFAPKPILVTSAVKDYFPIAGARATVEDARRLHPGVQFFEYDDTHGWSKPRREAMYQFLDRNLLGKQKDVKEEPVTVEPEKNLLALPGWKPSVTVATITRDSVAKIIAARKPDVRPATIRQRLAIGKLDPEPVNLLGAGGNKPVMITLGATTAEVDIILKQGFTVAPLAVPQPPGGKSGYDADYQAAARAWLWGHTPAAQQVERILNAFRWLEDQSGVDAQRIGVFARGASGPAAIYAAALEPRIRTVCVLDSMESYLEIVRGERTQGIALLVVPGVLLDFDLPDVSQRVTRAKTLSDALSALR
jgi:cephalosporin-C deacetylase-like acetyl esterase